jgi:ABC-2 type transport system permease protein
MEGYLFLSSFSDYLRLKRLIPWLLVAAAVFGIAYSFRSLKSDFAPTDAYVLLVDTLVFRILPLAAAVFSSAVVAQEVEQKTIVYLLTRPVPRWKLILYRSLAAMAVVFIVSALAAIGVSLGSFGGANRFLVSDLEAIALGSVAYVALFTFASLLVNRSTILCLLFAFVWETSVPNVPGDLYRLTITSYVSAIAHHPAISGAGKGFLDAISGILGQNDITAQAALPILAGLAVVCVCASCYWFSHFEYMAREDAE